MGLMASHEQKLDAMLFHCCALTAKDRHFYKYRDFSNMPEEADTGDDDASAGGSSGGGGNNRGNLESSPSNSTPSSPKKSFMTSSRGCHMDAV